MKPVDIFTVIVKAIGLIICVVSGAMLFFALINLVLGGPASPIGLIIVGGPPFLVGLWLLRGADSVIAYSFPEAKHTPMDETQR